MCSEFSVVTQSMKPFSGPGSSDAFRWIKDFERNCDSDDDAYKLKCVRRLMKPDSDADLFVHVDRSTNYAAFKENFLKTFGRSHFVVDVVNQLKSTKFEPSKMSVLGYILKMQEIAERAAIEEEQTVHMIIDGLCDKSADIGVLYSANTIEQLIKRSHRYTQLRMKRCAERSSSFAIKDSGRVRCYNCSGYGHFANACSEPKRAKGSCFRWGSTQHTIKECKMKTTIGGRSVAFASEHQPESGKGGLPELNMRY
ncbi:uncharacterized protein LOC128264000 [Drosophila gunungcola]|uniref:uncharacterized protein LOC128264000 n=1 Tax=Drosophila gunungcola TaxID=103775 RepID=UPI0022E69CE4|nr:uncharacterized protein LOC128264000 [Drosophila gunungcola]